MNEHDPRSLLVMILVANAATAWVTIVAAIRRPMLSYRLIAALAAWAVVASFQQVVSNEFNWMSLLVNTMLVLSIAFHGVLKRHRNR
jgi:hypothetical protein